MTPAVWSHDHGWLHLWLPSHQRSISCQACFAILRLSVAHFARSNRRKSLFIVTNKRLDWLVRTYIRFIFCLHEIFQDFALVQYPEHRRFSCPQLLFQVVRCIVSLSCWTGQSKLCRNFGFGIHRARICQWQRSLHNFCQQTRPSPQSPAPYLSMPLTTPYQV